MNRTLGLVAVAAFGLGVLATYAAARTPAPRDAFGHVAAWSSGVSTWHYDDNAPNRLILVHRDVGSAGSNDDTRTVTARDAGGTLLTTHASPWRTLDVSRFVPATARAVQLSFKAIITKGTSNGLATVFVFVRRAGSHCCSGPASSPSTPVDYELPDGEQVESVAVAVAQQPSDGVRNWSTFELPLVGGKLEWAWGYRRVEGNWPAGDAVGFEMYLDGYATP